jgi:hypothetical protein
LLEQTISVFQLVWKMILVKRKPRNKVQGFSVRLALRLIGWACVHSKDGVDGAKADEAGGEENDGQHHQADSHNSGEYICEIQCGYCDCDDESYNSVDASHVLFHDFDFKRSKS